MTSRVSNNEDDFDDKVEVLLLRYWIKLLKIISSVSLLDATATSTKMPLSNKEKLLHDDSDISKKSDFIKVNRPSGKSMRVDREQYDQV